MMDADVIREYERVAGFERAMRLLAEYREDKHEELKKDIVRVFIAALEESRKTLDDVAQIIADTCDEENGSHAYDESVIAIAKRLGFPGSGATNADLGLPPDLKEVRDDR
jgi:hypothetical protein